MEIENMIVSYSEVFKFQTCERQYYYNFNQNLQPIEMSHAITTGTKGHKLLQSFYTAMQTGMTKEAALQLTHDRAKRLMEEERFADFDLLQAWTLVDNYVRANEFNSEAVLVENRFLFPFADICKDPAYDNIQIGFTPDVVFERKGGFLDVEDSKFIQKAWPTAKLNRFQQAKLYQIFLLRMGYNVTRSVIRFFNVKTGVITAKTYPYLKEEEKTLIHDFSEGIKRVVDYRRQEPWVRDMAPRTMNYTACQFCHYETPCTLEAEGKSAEKTFKHFYKPGDYSYE